MDKVKYCLYRHVAAYHRQVKCRDTANFAEACNGCRLFGECNGFWTEMLLPEMPEDAHISLGCPASRGQADNRRVCSDSCIHLKDHIRSQRIETDEQEFPFEVFPYNRQRHFDQSRDEGICQ